MNTTEHIVRLVICAVAVLWAIARVHQTGNYTRIRLYLYAVLADVVGLGIYGLMVDWRGTGYQAAYTASYTLLGILAILAARAAAQHVPAAVTAFVVNAAIIASLVSWYQSDHSAQVVLLGVEAGLFFIAGMSALAAAQTPGPYAAPMLTLGSLWLVQMGFFYLYAAGIGLSRPGWEAIGDWLPTAIAVVAFGKLGFDFKHEPQAQLAQQTQ